MSLEFRHIAELKETNLQKFYKFVDLLDSYEASLDLGHLGLQLNSLDKDLFDLR